MKTIRLLFHLVRADFMERTRRYSFLITVGVAVFVAYSFLPPSDAKYVAIDLGGYRGLYNSAWVGSSAAMMTTVYLSLAGFYLVKNAIQRDYQTGVGQIIATTPLRKPFYTLGKALSNYAVLALIVGIVVVASGVVQFLRGEDLHLDPGALMVPFLVIPLPAMALVAALAVLFETLPGLRSSPGNVAYFFFWMMVIGVAGATVILGNGILSAILDPLGAAIPMPNMLSAARALPDSNGGFGIGPYPLEGGPLKAFRWDGMQWTASLVAGRLVWVGIALGIALLAALFFDRFSSSQGTTGGSRESIEPNGSRESAKRADGLPSLSVHLGALPAGTRRFSFVRTVLVELRLLLKGHRWWLYVVAAGLVVAGLVTPLDLTRQIWLPLAWVWPLTIWSSMGSREVQHRTDQLVFSAAFPLRRQLPAAWMSGFLVALAMGGGAAVRLLFTGGGNEVFALLVGAAFVPSLAFALGAWSGSRKLFEVIYLVIWYVGPINGFSALDYLGATHEAIARGVPLVYLALTALLLGLAVVGRRRQIQM